MRTSVELFFVFLIIPVGLSQAPNTDNDVSFNLGSGLVDKASKILDKLGETLGKIKIDHLYPGPLPEPLLTTLGNITGYYAAETTDAKSSNDVKKLIYILALVLLGLLMLLIIVAMICCCVITAIYAVTQKRKYAKEHIPPPATVVVSQPQSYQPSPPPPVVAPLSSESTVTKPQLSPEKAKPILPPTSPIPEPKVEKLAKSPELNEQRLKNPPKDVATQSEKPPKNDTKDIALQTEPKKEKEKKDKESKDSDDKKQPPPAPPLPGFKEVEEKPKDPEEKPKPKDKKKTPKQVKGDIIDKGVQTDLDSSDDEKYRARIRGDEALPGRNRSGPRTELVV